MATLAIGAFTLQLRKATVGLIVATDKLAKDARDSGETQSGISRQMFLAENRPWLSVKPSIASDLTYDTQGNARISINFLVTNIGKGPAVGISVEAKLDVSMDPPALLLRHFVEMHKSMNRGLDYGFTLFPSEPMLVTLGLVIPIQDMEAISMMWTEKTKKEITAYAVSLIGCVIYRFTFEEGVHQTGIHLDLNKIDPQRPNLNLMIDTKDGIVPAQLLRLSHARISMPPD